jgi:sorbitol-specific phosphotransferase system component IIC
MKKILAFGVGLPIIACVVFCYYAAYSFQNYLDEHW